MASAPKAFVSAMLALATFLCAPFWCAADPQSASLSNQADRDIERLLSQLYATPYEGPMVQTISPTCWRLGFTEPMEALLEMGPPAQGPLLSRISEPAIKDQVIMILGGLADEHAIGPIIKAMVPATRIETVPNSRQINLCASLALTNMTLAAITFGRSGGTIVWPCPDRPRECWASWWKDHEGTFIARGTKESRRYGSHTDFGIYITR